MATTTTVVTPIVESTIMLEKRSSTAERFAADPANHGIRVVAPYEYKQAAACLAEAFKHDHTVRYAIDTPDRMHWSEAQRYKLHRQALEYVTYAHCLRGLVTAIGPNYDCVALWMPPGKNVDDWVTIFRSGMWRLGWQLSTEGRERFFNEFLPLLATTKAEVLGDRENHAWHLNYIGTKEASRGKGYARQLIEHISAVADRAGQPCYLESSHEVNLIIYGKLGYKPHKKIFLTRADHEVRMDIMVREPVKVKEEK